jgi:hypothetical protein
VTANPKPTPGARRINFLCNDCDRGFTSETAWLHHGETTGHNINGDLAGRDQRRIQELEEEVRKLKTAYELLGQERARFATKLNGIACLMEL